MVWKGTDKMKYALVEGSRVHLDSQVVGETLEGINGKYGMVTPSVVVEESKPVDAPLHNHFQWDDSKAAEEYRLVQARQLIRAVTVMQDAKEDKEVQVVRAFVNVRPVEGDEPLVSERCYITIQRAMGEEMLRRQVLANALAEIRSWRRRYAQYTEFAKIVGAVDETQKSLFDAEAT